LECLLSSYDDAKASVLRRGGVLIEEGGKDPHDAPPLTRSTFLYMEPRPQHYLGEPNEERGIPKVAGEKGFASCGTCVRYTGSSCSIHGRDLKVPSDASCALYVPGEPSAEEGSEVLAMTPEWSGYCEETTQCQGCVSYCPRGDRGICSFFTGLNHNDPCNFALDADVHGAGRCNAWRGTGGKDEE